MCNIRTAICLIFPIDLHISALQAFQSQMSPSVKHLTFLMKIQLKHFWILIKLILKMFLKISGIKNHFKKNRTYIALVLTSAIKIFLFSFFWFSFSASQKRKRKETLASAFYSFVYYCLIWFQAISVFWKFIVPYCVVIKLFFSQQKR